MENDIRKEIETKITEPIAVKDSTIEALGISEDQILDLRDQLDRIDRFCEKEYKEKT